MVLTDLSAMYARKQIANAERVSDKASLYDIVGLTPVTAENPDAKVSFADYMNLLETIAESEWPDLKFHMKTSQGMRCEEFGVFGLAFKSAPTLQQGLYRIRQFVRLHNTLLEFGVAQEGKTYVWSMQSPPVTRLGAALSYEAAMGTVLTFCREVVDQHIVPKAVYFSHEREGSTDALEAFFGCVPVFGAERNALVFDLEQVAQPCAVGDKAIFDFMTSHLEQELQAIDEKDVTFEGQVVEEISKLLTGGVPHLSDVATTMGLGERTLQRRLSERGMTFQTLVDQARHQLAQQLVGTTSYSLVEIAFMTGFSEQSAFSRAFKRWSGQSPRAFRQSLQSDGVSLR